MNEIIQVLSDYIRNETGHSGDISPDEDLLTSGIIDSFNIVSLAMFAQERFGVELDDDDMVRNNLARLSTLAALIERRLADKA